MKQLKKFFDLVPNDNIDNTTTNENKMLHSISVIIMVIFSMTTISSCLVTTYGKSPERLENDVIKIKIYKNSFAKEKQVEAKLKLLIDKELSDNNYVDYVVLDHLDVTYKIKFFKSIQDKLSFIDNIQDQKKYLDSLINCPNGKYTELAKQLLVSVKMKEQAEREKIERFINLVQVNSQNIRIGMKYSALDSLLKIRDIDPFPDITANMMKPSYLINSTSYAMSLAGFLYLKFENGILKEWHIIPKWNNSGIDVQTNSGVTKLIEAISKGFLSKVDSLLNLGANPNVPDKNANSPLIYCAWLDDIYSARLLLEKGANVNYTESANGTTALYQAAAYSSDDLVLLLLEKGSNANIKAKNDLTALYEALLRNRFKTADILLSHGADPNSAICGVPLICNAIIENDTIKAKLLMKYSAKTDAIIQKLECTPQNSPVGKNAFQLAEDNLHFLEILKMTPSIITTNFINKEEALPKNNFSISTTGRIVMIEGNRILFEVSKGNIKVLKFNSQTTFQKKEGQTFINTDGPSSLIGFPIVTARCDMQLNTIIKMYEGGIFFTGAFETY